MSETQQCVSCGADLTGPFCSKCGEQRLTPEHRKVRYILFDFLQNLTSVDGKLLRSFAHLCFKPGLYDYHYHIGARNQYIKPITLFLMVNVIYVTFISLNDFFLQFGAQRGQFYYSLVQGWVDERIADSGLTAKEFAVQYDKMVKVLARSIIITSVPFLLPFVVLACHRKQYYLSDHLVFSLNIYAWFMLAMLFFWWSSVAIVKALGLIGLTISPFTIFGTVFPMCFIAYMYLATKQMYKQQTWRCVWSLVILFVGFVFSHAVYRLLQLVFTVLAL